MLLPIFIRISSKSVTHPLSKCCFNSDLSVCLYSTHEWLGSWYANCYLTEPTIMACLFLSATFLCVNIFFFDHTFSLLWLWSGFCCLIQAFWCLYTSLCTVRPNPQLGIISNEAVQMHYIIFQHFLFDFSLIQKGFCCYFSIPVWHTNFTAIFWLFKADLGETLSMFCKSSTAQHNKQIPIYIYGLEVDV